MLQLHIFGHLNHSHVLTINSECTTVHLRQTQYYEYLFTCAYAYILFAQKKSISKLRINFQVLEKQ